MRDCCDGDLESLAAGLARDVVVEAEQVVAQLCELGPVARVGPGRQSTFLRVPYPPNAVVDGPSALGALIPSESRFRFFREKRAFVEGHALMVAIVRCEGGGCSVARGTPADKRLESPSADAGFCA